MERILVTGVAGFIGSHVSRRLMAEGYEVVGVDDLSTGNLNAVPSGLDFIQADLACPDTMRLLPRDCRYILHLAGQSSGEISFDDPVGDLSKNVISTLRLIRYAIDNDVKKCLYASSMSVYGSTSDRPVSEEHACRPLSCYGVGKLTSEHYLKVYESSLPSSCLRMFNVYGPGQELDNLRQGMVSIYLAQAITDGRIHVRGSLDRFRDFIFIDDVVEIWLRALHSEDSVGQKLNVGTGIRTSVRELLSKVEELVPGSYSVVGEGTPGDQEGIFADISNLQSCLGQFEFTQLEEGLRIFADWARNAQTRSV